MARSAEGGAVHVLQPLHGGSRWRCMLAASLDPRALGAIHVWGIGTYRTYQFS